MHGRRATFRQAGNPEDAGGQTARRVGLSVGGRQLRGERIWDRLDPIGHPRQAAEEFGDATLDPLGEHLHPFAQLVPILRNEARAGCDLSPQAGKVSGKSRLRSGGVHRGADPRDFIATRCVYLAR